MYINIIEDTRTRLVAPTKVFNIVASTIKLRMGKHSTPWSTKMNQKGDLAAVQVYEYLGKDQHFKLKCHFGWFCGHFAETQLKRGFRACRSWQFLVSYRYSVLYKTNPIPAYTSHHLHDFVVAIVSALVRELLVLLQGIIFSTAIWILLMNFKHFSDSKNHHSLPRGSSGNRNFPFSCHWGGFDENYAPGE